MVLVARLYCNWLFLRKWYCRISAMGKQSQFGIAEQKMQNAHCFAGRDPYMRMAAALRDLTVTIRQLRQDLQSQVILYVFHLQKIWLFECYTDSHSFFTTSV